MNSGIIPAGAGSGLHPPPNENPREASHTGIVASTAPSAISSFDIDFETRMFCVMPIPELPNPRSTTASVTPALGLTPVGPWLNPA